MNEASLRVALVTPEYAGLDPSCGGLGQYILRFARALVAQGHGVHVIVPWGESFSRVEDGVTVHAVWHGAVANRVERYVPDSRKQTYRLRSEARAVWKVWRRLRQDVAFDVVQLANVRAVGLHFHKERNVSVVVRFSNDPELWDRSAGVDITEDRKRRWALEWGVPERIGRGYAPSCFIGERASERLAYSVPVLETPYFRDDAAEEELLPEVGPFVFYFGSLTTMKGVDVLAEAMASVFATHGSVQLVLAGADGPGPKGGAMSRYVRKTLSSFDERVHVTGRVGPGAIRSLLRRAELVVIPSRFDNLPNTCLEAMHAGKVVVGSDGGGLEQLIVQGKSGFRVPVGDVLVLAHTITQGLGLSDDARAAMEAHAREAVARLHPDVAIPKWVAYIRRIMKGEKK